jgi:hypothetical protein
MTGTWAVVASTDPAAVGGEWINNRWHPPSDRCE